jgi:hypothetical protein
MVDVRKIIIIFVVAILFAVLVFAVIEAAYPSPQYEDFCKDTARTMPIVKEPTDCVLINISQQDQSACDSKKGFIEYNYDSRGCAVSYDCNTCNNDYNQAQQQHSRYVFYISAVLALIAIFVGMYLPAQNNTLNEWMGTGFMLGGAFALFFGTASSFRFLDRIVRPIIIFLELALVIFVSYKKIGNLRQDKKK